ncbi:hypothetical protein C8R46DRAFT_1304969 [Mycena filopes]|nr:hypothetical protein C8R46DRAFT_1304969 [Mycena filopes]
MSFPPQLNVHESPPHFTDPLVAPRPHRVDPQIGVNSRCGATSTARSSSGAGPYQGGQPNPYNPNPSARTPSPLPPSGEWSPWAGAAGAAAARTPSPMPPRLPSPPRDGSLTAPLPTLAALNAALPSISAAAPDAQLAWARDVLFLVDRTPTLSTSPLALAAVPLVLSLAQSAVPEAVYYRATFAASGTYPALLPANPRAAFRDFEAAARAGWAPAWFRLARDYEAFADTAHALDCLNRGAKARDAAALHRLGTAYLLAQLGVREDTARAVELLHLAALRASLLCPQPAYVFGLILLSEFGAAGGTGTITVPPALLAPLIPAGQTRETYARSMLERAAALHFAPAQYKLGHAFEFAVPASAFPFDPLLSVQWYSLASQAGEAEADMALSKWFLCGAEGAFDKDESLARTFAAKAAAKGLASGEFAMGYYAEVGIGGGKELGEARGWYEKAAAHGNADAGERLKALALAVPQALSRTEHDALTGDKLVRKRTQARLRSDRQGSAAGGFDYRAGGGGPPPGAGGAMPPYGSPPAGYGGPQNGNPYAGPGPGAPNGSGRGRMPAIGERREGSVSQQQGPPGQGRMPQQQPPPPGRDGSLPPGAGRQGAGRGYALSDSGSRPGSVAGSVASGGGGGGGAGGRVQGTPPLRRPGGRENTAGGIGTPAPAPAANLAPHGGSGPATFAEMGFTGAKAEDKECVIM